MIDVHLVVEGQRMISLAPVVTDVLFTVYDQRIDLQLGKACCDRETGLPAADDQYSRVPVGVLGGALPEVEPVGSPEIARIGLTVWPRPSDLLPVALYFIERREQRPRLQSI